MATSSRWFMRRAGRLCTISSVCLFLATTEALALPEGLVEETVLDGLTKAVGVSFAPDGRMFVWEKGGKVWTVIDGQIGGEPLIDLSDEVLNWWDHGLLGFTIDPDFYDNGYIYVLYVVDWEYYITGGNPDPANQDKKHDTFGRITRYTARAEDDFQIVDSASRQILLGPSHDTGIPITSGSHGADTLLFASDGTLLASCGEGADFTHVDSGGPRNGSFSTNTAEIDGIISLKEQIGAFRSQLVDSHSGKLLRIDPETGNGVPSNPFFDAEAPQAPRSRVWSVGWRNPFRFTLRPGTGSTNPGDGDPGTLYVGDVGWADWEEFDVIDSSAANAGWPLFEGLSPHPDYAAVQVDNLDAPNPLYDGTTCLQEFFPFGDLLVQDSLNSPSWPNPCDTAQQIPPEFTSAHHRPHLEWYHDFDRARVPSYDAMGNAIEVNIEDSAVEGEPFSGFTSVGGVWYVGDKFPADFQNTYFLGDATQGWIKALTLNDDDQLMAVREFLTPGSGVPVCMAVDPAGYALYYVHYSAVGATSELRRVVADCNANGVGDDTDLLLGASLDLNANGIPDECDDPPPPCAGDANGDGTVDPLDSGYALARLGCPVGAGNPDCDAADQNADGVVDPLDAGFILARFGPCP